MHKTCRRLGSTIAISLALFAAGTAARAADPRHYCADITDDASRLACYDQAFGSPAKSGAPGAASAQPSPVAGNGVVAPPSSPSAASSAPGAAVATSAAVASASPTTAAPVAVAPEYTPLEKFGFHGDPPQPKSAPQRAVPAELNSITSVIESVAKRPLGQLSVTLENGQVWTQTEAEAVRLKAGDTVTIKKASLGSYKLVSGSVTTVVKRVR